MQQIARVVACASILVLTVAVAGIGRQLIVSKDTLGAFRSIQAAMNEAEHGDTIRVDPGIFEEQIEFKNGITVIGAGADRTIIRYGYGFDEVLHARNVIAGRIEHVTLQRLESVLDAPVVVLESAALTLSDCVISGGQEEGIRATGLSAQAILESCEIVANGSAGILCEAGAVLHVIGGSFRDNGGAGLRVIDSSVEVNGTVFESNGAAGMVLEGSSRAVMENAAFTDHTAWAIDCTDGGALELADCRFVDNAAGGVRVEGSSTAHVRDSRFVGGAMGIEARSASAIEIRGGTVQEATEVGIRVLGNATCRIESAEVVECSGHGIELASTESAEVLHATIACNGGDGIVVAGEAVAVTNTIVASNAGVGLRVSQAASSSDPPTFGYNAVWGNALGDYVGTTRRSSDVSAYPGFVDVGRRDYALRLESPCVNAGERGTTIGAHVDPSRSSGTAVVVAVRRDGGPWGLDVSGKLRLKAAGPLFDGVQLRVSRQWDRAELSLESSQFGAGSSWLRADGAVRLVDVEIPSDTGSPADLRVTLGGAGILDGVGSRWSLSVAGEVRSDTYSVFGDLAWEGPTGGSSQSLRLTLGSFSFSARATELTLNALDGAASAEVILRSGVLLASAGLSMLPERKLHLDAEWETTNRSLAAQLGVYIEDPASGNLSIAWTDFDRGSRIDLVALITDLALADVAVRAAVRLANLSIDSEIGVSLALGVRYRLTVEMDTADWFLPRMNVPPAPAFGYVPREPEAAEAIAFDASEAIDPDGTVVEYWWDFGDGAVDIGNPIVHSYAEAGEYAVALTIADDDGDTATLVQSVRVFEADTTPVASFTWFPLSEAGTRLPRSLRAGDRVQFDASSSYDPDGAIVEFAWDFESDGIFELVVDRPHASIDPLGTGTWPVTLRVVDDVGRADAVMRVLRVEELKPPEAAFETSPSRPSIYDPVRFIDRSVSLDGDIVAWEWLFGDGHASREPEPIHRFEAVGRYEVSLTVTDWEGLAASHSELLDVQQTPGVVPVADVWALVIGITDYEEVEDLPYARRDAEAVVRWLLGNGVPQEQIRLLTDGETELDGQVGLTVSPATLINVREALGWLRRVASRDDLVLIHFSGHGYQGADDGMDEPDGVDEFFVLSDTRAAARDDTALRDDEFGRFLDRIASDHVLVFFDSCYAGGLSRSLPAGRRSSGSDQDWFGDLRLEGRLVLAASSEGEEAFESPRLEHGVFTHFLLEGLDGAADLNADYHVTVWELYEYVAERVPEFVRAERGEPQHPQLIGEGETRIILSLTSRPLDAAFSYCPAVPYAGGPIVFTDESSVSQDAVRDWTFEGETSGTGAWVVHAFEEPGLYEVSLRLSNETGELAESRIVVRVGPPGRITGIDVVSGGVLISLGARNGVRIGDRFEVAGGSLAETRTLAVLEVLELLDEDRAACRVIDGAGEPRVNDRLVPLDSACAPVDQTAKLPPQLKRQQEDALCAMDLDDDTVPR